MFARSAYTKLNKKGEHVGFRSAIDKNKLNLRNILYLEQRSINKSNFSISLLAFLAEKIFSHSRVVEIRSRKAKRVLNDLLLGVINIEILLFDSRHRSGVTANVYFNTIFINKNIIKISFRPTHV